MEKSRRGDREKLKSQNLSIRLPTDELKKTLSVRFRSSPSNAINTGKASFNYVFRRPAGAE
ncbi:MAG: hypothetical protein LBL42_05775 [Tannerella sp.]|nr:hypothetical protein [Tannerella sp.]